MLKFTRVVSFALFLALVLSACNFPSADDESNGTEGSDAVLTAAAQTAEANLTQSAILNPPTIPPTNTAGIPTSTLAVATTSAPPTNPPPTQSCDIADFIEVSPVDSFFVVQNHTAHGFLFDSMENSA